MDALRPRTDYRLVTENDELKRRIYILEQRYDEQQKEINNLLKIVGQNSFRSFSFNKDDNNSIRKQQLRRLFR